MIEWFGLFAVSFFSAPSAGETIWIQAERIIVRPGEETSGAVLVQNGVIVAVGEGVTAPEGARSIQGRVVCAGFLDAWSTLGMDSAAAAEAKSSPATRALDGLDPYGDDHLRRETLEAGVTSLRIQAGVESPLSGLSAVVRNDPGASTAGLTLLADAAVAATIGVTRAGRTPDVFDRVNEVDKLVSSIEAGLAHRKSQLDYEEKLAAWKKEIAAKEEELDKDFKKAKKKRDDEKAEAEEEGKEFKEGKYKEEKQPNAPRFDADKDVLARVGAGELPLVVEVHRAPELRELLAKTKPFARLRLILAGASEARPFADELAERHIAVIVWPAPMGLPRVSEYEQHDLELAAALHEAGVTVLFGSGGEGGARDLPVLAALAVAHGLERQAALEALTLAPARSFDLSGRIGTVERGKDADLLVLDGEPLDVATRPRYVILGGQVVVEP